MKDKFIVANGPSGVHLKEFHCGIIQLHSWLGLLSHCYCSLHKTYIVLTNTSSSNHNYYLQISYASSSTTLLDRNRFKRFFRNSLTLVLLLPSLQSIMKRYNWTRILLFTLDENHFKGVCEHSIATIIVTVTIQHDKSQRDTCTQFIVHSNTE